MSNQEALKEALSPIIDRLRFRIDSVKFNGNKESFVADLVVSRIEEILTHVGASKVAIALEALMLNEINPKPAERKISPADFETREKRIAFLEQLAAELKSAIESPNTDARALYLATTAKLIDAGASKPDKLLRSLHAQIIACLDSLKGKDPFMAALELLFRKP